MQLRARRIARTVAVILIVSTSPVAGLSQTNRRRPLARAPQVLERNVRAQLGFLASDAMQGRGSGTGYERIAAEYIGSQFRQFGLEPGGDDDGTGAAGYVQKVAMESTSFTEAPMLSVSAGTSAHKYVYGHDFSLSFIRSAFISAPLQLLAGDEAPAKGAFVLVKDSEKLDGPKRQELVRKIRAAQSLGVVIMESDTGRKTREAGELKLPALPAHIKGEKSEDSPFVLVSLRKEAFAELAGMAAGSLVNFGGATRMTETGATWNAVGVLRGSDPVQRGDAIMLSAHLDHLGVNESAGTDIIFNGADDDASGCVAVLELARALAAGRKPHRTIYFICFGSEERGGYGARYFISHSPVPLDHIVADITFEMLGRPDAKVAANTLWLTGYDRSDLGPTLASQGARLVADPHPEQNFFQRSDNYTLAVRGVVAHTVSSFGLHADYHRPSDEVSKIDFAFMTKSIDSMITPVRWLANSSFRPQWLPGRAPERNP